MNSEYTSQQTSVASSRMQSPLTYEPKHSFIYTVKKFINKIPPVIKYGLPGFAIGHLAPMAYHAVQNKFNELRNSLNPNTNETKENKAPVPKSKDPKGLKSPPKPNETPIPRSTYNPAHPRTGYRYHVPFND